MLYSLFPAERVIVRAPAAPLRRIAAVCATALLCVSPAISRSAAARADGREQLASAIANTRGSYLVYNFGGGYPAPMLNAGGNWYEMTNGGHLMIIKAASQRLAPAAAGRLAQRLPGAV